jgi:hypothetical protein
MTYENFILNGHSFTDEGVRGNFTSGANKRILLNFHKRANLCLITDRATIQVH